MNEKREMAVYKSCFGPSGHASLLKFDSGVRASILGKISPPGLAPTAFRSIQDKNQV